MRISGRVAGINRVVFDWLEEEACCDCRPEPYDAIFAAGEKLNWQPLRGIEMNIINHDEVLDLIDELTFERMDYVRRPARSNLDSTDDPTMYETQTFRLVNADILKGFIEARRRKD